MFAIKDHSRPHLDTLKRSILFELHKAVNELYRQINYLKIFIIRLRSLYLKPNLLAND